jgi:hypothetical protein
VGHLLLVELLLELCHLIWAQRTEVNNFGAGVDNLGFDFGQRRVTGLMMDRWR